MLLMAIHYLNTCTCPMITDLSFGVHCTCSMQMMAMWEGISPFPFPSLMCIRDVSSGELWYDGYKYMYVVLGKIDRE